MLNGNDKDDEVMVNWRCDVEGENQENGLGDVSEVFVDQDGSNSDVDSVDYIRIVNECAWMKWSIWYIIFIVYGIITFESRFSWF